jgi:hypothetical protein
MSAGDHNTEFEELMALMDGELDAAAAVRVRAHVAACGQCQQMEHETAGVSARMAEWMVVGAPPALARDRSPRARAARSRWLPIAATLVIGVGGTVLWLGTQHREAPSVDEAAAVPVVPVGQPAETAAPEPAYAYTAKPSILAGNVADSSTQVAGSLLIRNAQLALMVRSLDEGRAAMERIVKGSGGFIGNINVSGAGGDTRSLSASLRVPTAKLDETLVALKRLGQVTSEGQSGEDVTQRSTDLDARLSNSRAAEMRLKDILTHRTGKLSDVLEVEREISRVRGEIEQMEAERKSLDRRITYAIVSVQMIEERKAAVDLGPSVSSRLRNALIDGWNRAVSSALDAAVAIVGIMPVVLLWTIVIAPPLWLIKRRFSRAS